MRLHIRMCCVPVFLGRILFRSVLRVVNYQIRVRHELGMPAVAFV